MNTEENLERLKNAPDGEVITVRDPSNYHSCFVVRKDGSGSQSWHWSNPSIPISNVIERLKKIIASGADAKNTFPSY